MSVKITVEIQGVTAAEVQADWQDFITRLAYVEPRASVTAPPPAAAEPTPYEGGGTDPDMQAVVDRIKTPGPNKVNPDYTGLIAGHPTPDLPKRKGRPPADPRSRTEKILGGYAAPDAPTIDKVVAEHVAAVNEAVEVMETAEQITNFTKTAGQKTNESRAVLEKILIKDEVTLKDTAGVIRMPEKLVLGDIVNFGKALIWRYQGEVGHRPKGQSPSEVDQKRYAALQQLWIKHGAGTPTKVSNIPEENYDALYLDMVKLGMEHQIGARGPMEWQDE